MLVTAGFSGWAQVRLSGEVSHEGAGLDQVSIKVVEDGKVLRTLAVNRRGKYETEIPFDKQYVLVFTRPFMFPVSIDIDTRMFEELPETVYEVTLNMSMFHRFSRIDDQPFKASIGVVKKTGKGEDAFSFVPNTKAIAQIKRLHAEIQQRFAAGEAPIEDSESLEREERTFDAFTEEVPVDEPVGAEAAETPPERKVEKASLKEEDDVVLDIDAQKRHHAREEEVQVISRSKQRNSWEDQRSALQQEDDRMQEEIQQSKRARQEWAEQHEKEQTLLAEARAAKQERLSSMGASRSSATSNVTPSIQVIDFRTSEGIWLSEERLLVSENGKRIEYVRASYDWLLFEVVTCSKNGEEIAEQEYEQVKALVGI